MAGPPLQYDIHPLAGPCGCHHFFYPAAAGSSGGRLTALDVWEHSAHGEVCAEVQDPKIKTRENFPNHPAAKLLRDRANSGSILLRRDR